MLNKLPKSTQKRAKTIGRGYGSKKGGHTVGKGTKGQKSRAGYKIPRPGFEGGQMPLSRRLPKFKGFSRGYYNANQKVYLLNLSDLNKFYNDGDQVSLETLIGKGLIKAKSKDVQIKICAKGKLDKKIDLVGIKASQNAVKHIQTAGGKVN